MSLWVVAPLCNRIDGKGFEGPLPQVKIICLCPPLVTSILHSAWGSTIPPPKNSAICQTTARMWDPLIATNSQSPIQKNPLLALLSSYMTH